MQRIFDTLAIKANTVRMVKDFSDDFPEVFADSDKIEQVLMNLIGNALKYSPPDGRVVVSGFKQGDEIEVVVTDNGPGIAESEHEKIFDKFYRQDNETNRKNPGTGLGLPICQTLINLHGGRIWVESEPGQGCRFIFRLPLNIDKVTR